MARLARVVVADVPHHVTQRGNARRFLLDCDSDRRVYLELLREDTQRCRVAVLGYCLMSNHVHLVLVPGKAEALAIALKRTHGRYAAYWNTLYQSSGHVWQGRYYSCPLDQDHLWRALRYTELNPVRAGLVAEARSWMWSSAALHCGEVSTDGLIDLDPWRRCWPDRSWSQYLKAEEDESEQTALRRCTFSGRPLGSVEFVKQLEQATGRRLSLRKPANSQTLASGTRQGELILRSLSLRRF
jgi:putative transposase